MNTQVIRGNWNVIVGEMRQHRAQPTDDEFRCADGEEEEWRVRGLHRQTGSRPPLATIMTTRTKVNGRLPKKVPVQWESLDMDWKPVVIKHVSCSPKSITRWRRVWQNVLATLRS
jgi:hypothetical protein